MIERLTSRTSYRIIIFLILTFAAFGFLDGVYPQYEAASFFIHTITIAVLLAVWCTIHAEENNITPPRNAKILCLLLGFFGVPYYLFKGYGFKDGGRRCLIGLGIFILATTLYWTCLYIASI